MESSQANKEQPVQYHDTFIGNDQGGYDDAGHEFPPIEEVLE